MPDKARQYSDRYKDFYIDEGSNGERYFIGAELVSQEVFIQRRDKECGHRWQEQRHKKICIDCGKVRP